MILSIELLVANNNMAIVRAEIELLDNNFHGVMYIREVSKLCMQLGYKPVQALGVCDRNGVIRFYVDIQLLPDQLLCEEHIQININQFLRIKAVNPTLNLMHNSLNSFRETYFDDSTQTPNFISSPYSFHGNTLDERFPCRDAYSESVSYTKLCA